MAGRVLRFPHREFAPEEIESSAERVLSVPLGERAARAAELRLEQPDVLLAVCTRLRDRLDRSPATVREEAEFAYRFLLLPNRPIGLFDEREYFLGEFALVAGTACRQLSRRDEARLWFDRAEAGFRHTMNAVADLSRLAYQRLALRLEERELETVLELVPSLVQSFQELSMPEEGLKAQFLEGLALLEGERLGESVDVFYRICAEAEGLGSEKLMASAYGNLTHLYAMQGDSAKAIEASQRAIPILKRLEDRVALAKVQWGLATLLRETGQLPAAVEAYRAAQQEFGRIGMRADVAALHLVVADLLLELGEEPAAAQLVLEALPVLQELNMIPEGMAALQLLRESLREQKINRLALRELHGFFEEVRS
jgi:tetratricopeptide (TPR) repeat protein